MKGKIKMKIEKTNNKIIKVIIVGLIVLLFLAILIPLAYQFFIVGNGVESKWSEEVWGGFLGGLWGGIIGGAGTLLAVLITTMDTRKIQSRNEVLREKDKNEAERLRKEDKLEFEETRKADKANEDRKERRAFADGIIEYIGKYITDISVYFYDNFSSTELNEELKEIVKELQKKEDNYGELIEQMSTMGMDDVDKLMQREQIQHKNSLDIDILRRRVQEKQSKINERKGDRTIANECFFVLQMKLDKIEIAQGLLTQLKHIHKDLFDKEFNWIDIESKKLIEKAEQFVNDYVN